MLKIFLITIFIFISLLLLSAINSLPVNSQTQYNYVIDWPRHNLTIKEKIYLVADFVGCNAQTLDYVAWRESSYQNIPNSTGSGAFGVMQFMRPTFYFMAKEAGLTYVNDLDYNNPDIQIYVACWAFKNGYSGHWSVLTK